MAAAPLHAKSVAGSPAPGARPLDTLMKPAQAVGKGPAGEESRLLNGLKADQAQRAEWRSGRRRLAQVKALARRLALREGDHLSRGGRQPVLPLAAVSRNRSKAAICKTWGR